MSDVTRLRVGSGFDVHAFEAGGRLVLAGVEVSHTHGLVGHSDADLVAHAVTDAILGGAGMADIGEYFPAEAVERGVDSMALLGQIVERVVARRCEIVNVDCVVVMQSPKLAPYREAMRANLAHVLGLDVDRITVRASTTDHLGFVGRAEGAAAIATCLVLRGE
ncbi:MAG: hypothetical protein JWN41_1367 [Thermoleophilia bacterium]|nr:hypothetical protein [Thermoleophilia bacterium]